MVTQFNPRIQQLGFLLKDNWNIIQNKDELTQIFRTKPIVGYERLPNLKDMLTSSTITYPLIPKLETQTTQFIPVCKRLGKCKCTECPKLEKKMIRSPVFILRNLCDLQYTGETKRPIKNRMYKHYSSVQYSL